MGLCQLDQSSGRWATWWRSLDNLGLPWSSFSLSLFQIKLQLPATCPSPWLPRRLRHLAFQAQVYFRPSAFCLKSWKQLLGKPFIFEGKVVLEAKLLAPSCFRSICGATCSERTGGSLSLRCFLPNLIIISSINIFYSNIKRPKFLLSYYVFTFICWIVSPQFFCIPLSNNPPVFHWVSFCYFAVEFWAGSLQNTHKWHQMRRDAAPTVDE